MGQITTIVINDGAATPVAHTFSPIGKDDKGVFWLEQTAPVPVNSLGAKRLGISLSRPVTAASLKSANARAVISLWSPVLEVLGNSSTGITPPATKAYELAGRCAFDLPLRSTKQEKKDVRVLFANALVNASVVSLIDELSSAY